MTCPINEQGVVFLFGKVAQDLNMYVEEIKTGFPDCIGRRFNGKGWERVRIEFEFHSSNFNAHKHDPSGCDLIICWEHDWPECKTEVIVLKELIPSLPNPMVTRPDAVRELGTGSDLDAAVAALDPHVRPCYHMVDEIARGLAPEVWSKFNGKDLAPFILPSGCFATWRFVRRPECA